MGGDRMGGLGEPVQAVEGGVIDVREEAPTVSRQVGGPHLPQLGQDLLGRDALVR
jgi:hypothetical protein